MSSAPRRPRIAGWRTVALTLLTGLGLIAAVLAVPSSSATADDDPPNYYWTGSMTIQVDETRTDLTGAEPPQIFQGSTTYTGDISTPAVHPRDPDPWGQPKSVLMISNVVGGESSPNVEYVPGTVHCGITSAHGPGVGDATTIDLSIEPGADGGPRELWTTSFDGYLNSVSFPAEHTYGCGPDDYWTESVEASTADYELLTCPGLGGLLNAPVPLLPAERQDNGELHISGTVAHTCNGESDEFIAVQRTQTYTLDLVGSPTPTETDLVRLTVTSKRVGSGIGTVVATGDAVNCTGTRTTTCTALVPRGTVIRLAALPGQWSKFTGWNGCANPCIVTMNGPISVTASFALDLDTVFPPEPDTLLSTERKIEVAQNGETAAREGALGCGKTAGVLAGGLAAGGAAFFGGLGVATRSQAIAWAVVEETFGECAEGVVGTIANGIMLKVDPPDPRWRKVAVPTRYKPSKAPKCDGSKKCRTFRKAWKKRAKASARSRELREAIGVATNRYGNAVNAGDLRAQRMHRATWRALGGMLATSVRAEARAGKRLVKALRKAGVRKLVVPKRVVRKALRSVAKGKGISKAGLRRAKKKRLVTSVKAARRDIRAAARSAKPTRIDVLAELRRGERTRAMRRDARLITLADLQIVLERLHVDRRVKASVRTRQHNRLTAAWACDAGTAGALRALAKDARRRSGGLGKQGGALVSTMALRLAKLGPAQGRGC